jgi:hypothetical protein
MSEFHDWTRPDFPTPEEVVMIAALTRALNRQRQNGELLSEEEVAAALSQVTDARQEQGER